MSSRSSFGPNGRQTEHPSYKKKSTCMYRRENHPTLFSWSTLPPAWIVVVSALQLAPTVPLLINFPSAVSLNKPASR